MSRTREGGRGREASLLIRMNGWMEEGVFVLDCGLEERRRRQGGREREG